MKAIILCYHKVGSEAEEGRWLNISTERLASHVRFFKRRRRRFIRAEELGGKWEPGLACLTFDDAYLSATDRAVPILQSSGATGTFYVVPSLVGKTSEWDAERARTLANWDQLRALQEAGFEIGNHSMGHPRMAEVDADRQAAEVFNAHAAMLARGLKPGSFCYPYGSWNASARQSVEAAGYKVGLALGKRPAHERDDRLVLPRIVVAFSDGLPKLLYKLWVRPKLGRAQ